MAADHQSIFKNILLPFACTDIHQRQLLPSMLQEQLNDIAKKHKPGNQV